MGCQSPRSGDRIIDFQARTDRLVDRLTKQSILLPMHDAILLQTEISQQESVKSEAVEIMRKAFTEFCPDVTPRVVAGVFANSDAAA